MYIYIYNYINPYSSWIFLDHHVRIPGLLQHLHPQSFGLSFATALGPFAVTLAAVAAVAVLLQPRRRLRDLPGLQGAVQAPAAQGHGLLRPLQTDGLGSEK